MSGDSFSEFAPELLDDFYSECDEQLGLLRQLLEQIEAAGGQETRSEFEAFFRNLHSLKGNAAIVGLREAEELAHAAEDYLRLLVSRDAVLGENGLSVLIQTVQRLEKTIGAHRHRSELPAVDDLCAQLKDLAGLRSPEVVGKTPDRQVPGKNNEVTFRFMPSRERDARGVNVNTVRARLAALGAITQSAPLVVEGGAVVFEFAVELRHDLVAEDWNEDGITRVDSPCEGSKSIEGPKTRKAHILKSRAGEESLFLAPSHIVRVDIGKLDDLLRIAGELVIQRSRLDDRLHGAAGGDRQDDLKEVNQALTRSLRELRDAITRVRLVPLAEVFSRLPFAVRDLVRNSDKKVRLSVEGESTEIDKFLVERLKEPFLHLVRNAVSHGIESSAERIAAGKPPEGVIHVHAAAVSGFVLIKIHDDGRGIDPRKIAERARNLNIALPAIVDERAMLEVICTPGFSTNQSVDLASGRGVGMNVVSDVVRELGGSLSLHTTPGVSTQFTLRLPLTLSIVEALIFTAEQQTYAIPQSAVEEIIEVSDDAIRSINHTPIVAYRDGVLPVVHLAGLFGRESKGKAGSRPVLVVHSELGIAGVMVDRVIGQREVVVRALKDPLVRVRGIAGATELGDGRPVLILDALALADKAVRPLSALAGASVV